MILKKETIDNLNRFFSKFGLTYEEVKELDFDDEIALIEK